MKTITIMTYFLVGIGTHRLQNRSRTKLLYYVFMQQAKQQQLYLVTLWQCIYVSEVLVSYYESLLKF